jgi:gliding motility-associated-like protein
VTTGAFNGFDLPCFGDRSALIYPAIAGSGTPPLSFNWSTGSNTDTLKNQGAGNYSLTITDANGCTGIESITLTQPPPIAYELIVDPIDCYGEQNGSIIIASATGGVDPWTISLNGNPYTNQFSFEGLSAGNFDLIIADQNDCSTTASLTITEPGDWQVNLGPDTTIAFGSPITLSPGIIGIPQGDLHFTWSDGTCADCTTRTFEFTSLTDVGVTVTDENGCTSADVIRIHITIDRDLLVPNIFTPNNDHINDVVIISASPSVKEIQWFRIYDRWGGLVFTAEKFQPNDPQFGWDGRMNGELLNPAVFTYQLLAHYEDGYREVRFGNITLMR